MDDAGLKERIYIALQSAKAAVAYDSKQDYTNATSSYKECIEIFDLNLDHIPEEHHPKVKELVS